MIIRIYFNLAWNHLKLSSLLDNLGLNELNVSLTFFDQLSFFWFNLIELQSYSNFSLYTIKSVVSNWRHNYFCLSVVQFQNRGNIYSKTVLKSVYWRLYSKTLRSFNFCGVSQNLASIKTTSSGRTFKTVSFANFWTTSLQKIYRRNLTRFERSEYSNSFLLI